MTGPINPQFPRGIDMVARPKVPTPRAMPKQEPPLSLRDHFLYAFLEGVISGITLPVRSFPMIFSATAGVAGWLKAAYALHCDVDAVHPLLNGASWAYNASLAWGAMGFLRGVVLYAREATKAKSSADDFFQSNTPT